MIVIASPGSFTYGSALYIVDLLVVICNGRLTYYMRRTVQGIVKAIRLLRSRCVFIEHTGEIALTVSRQKSR